MTLENNNTNNNGIGVIVIFSHPFKIYKVKHNNIEYLIDKIGFNYDKKIGDTRYHIFGVQSKNTFLRLSFNTKTLLWRLLEIDFIQ